MRKSRRTKSKDSPDIGVYSPTHIPNKLFIKRNLHNQFTQLSLYKNDSSQSELVSPNTNTLQTAGHLWWKDHKLRYQTESNPQQLFTLEYMQSVKINSEISAIFSNPQDPNLVKFSKVNNMRKKQFSHNLPLRVDLYFLIKDCRKSDVSDIHKAFFNYFDSFPEMTTLTLRLDFNIEDDYSTYCKHKNLLTPQMLVNTLKSQIITKLARLISLRLCMVIYIDTMNIDQLNGTFRELIYLAQSRISKLECIRFSGLFFSFNLRETRKKLYDIITKISEFGCLDKYKKITLSFISIEGYVSKEDFFETLTEICTIIENLPCNTPLVVQIHAHFFRCMSNDKDWLKFTEIHPLIKHDDISGIVYNTIPGCVEPTRIVDDCVRTIEISHKPLLFGLKKYYDY